MVFVVGREVGFVVLSDNVVFTSDVVIPLEPLVPVEPTVVSEVSESVFSDDWISLFEDRLSTGSLLQPCSIAKPDSRLAVSNKTTSKFRICAFFHL